MLLDSRESRKRNCKLPGPQTRKPCNLKSTKPQKTTLTQWVRGSSRATIYRACENLGRDTATAATAAPATTAAHLGGGKGPARQTGTEYLDQRGPFWWFGTSRDGLGLSAGAVGGSSISISTPSPAGLAAFSNTRAVICIGRCPAFTGSCAGGG